MGLAKASPTMATVLTLSRSMVSRSSTGSKWRSVSVTTHPAHRHGRHGGEAARAVHEGAGRQVRGARGPRWSCARPRCPPSSGTRSRLPGVEPGEQVVLAPHHALGHPRGPARCRAGRGRRRRAPRAAPPVPRRSGRRPRRESPTAGTGRCRRPPTARSGRLGTRERSPAMRSAERPVEDDRHGVGVVPQVDELVVGVAVIGVDRHQAGLQDAEGRLHVLGAVVEVVRHLVLVDALRARGGSGPRRWRAPRCRTK